MRSSPAINISSSLIFHIYIYIYINDLQYTWNLLDPFLFVDDTDDIMFADDFMSVDDNLFHPEENTKALFDTVNIELQKIGQWFLSNKSSLNVTKTKYSFFHKPSKKDNVLLVLQRLCICNNEIKRSESIKFLGIFLDENPT